MSGIVPRAVNPRIPAAVYAEFRLLYLEGHLRMIGGRVRAFLSRAHPRTPPSLHSSLRSTTFVDSDLVHISCDILRAIC